MVTFSLFASALLLASATAKTIPFDFEVVRADGKPAAEVEVYVCCTNPRAIEAPILATGKTDTSGMFHSSCEAPVGQDFVGVQVLVLSPDNQVGMALLAIRENNQQSPATKITLGPTADAKVVILQPDGSPAANMEVWVVGYSGKPVRGEKMPRYGHISKLLGDLWKATTDQDGRCVITRLPLDTAIYLNHADSRFAQPYCKQTLYAPTLPKSDGIERKIQLTKPGSVSGRIMYGDGTPAGNTLVSIIETTPYKTAYGGDVRTKEDGRFLMTQIPSSTYKTRITLSAPLSDEWISSEQKQIAVRDDETTDVGDIHLERAAIVTAVVLDEETDKKVEEPLTFRLPAGRSLVRYRMMRRPPKGYHVSGDHLEVSVNLQSGERKTVQFKLQPVKPSDMVTGSVLGLDGKPAANVSVMLTTEHSWARAEPTNTKEDGSFTITVPAEAAGVAAIAWDGAKSMSEITPAKRGQSIILQLKNDGFARVEGRVTDQSGFPIAGARVQWHAMQLRVSLMDNFDDLPDLVPETTDTDVDGHYVFPRLWTSLKPSISCMAEGYNRELKREVKLVPNQTEKLAFTLTQPGHLVKGVVVDSSGHPVEGASIQFSGDNQPDLHNNTKTDAQGTFQIGPLVSGRVYLRVFQETDDFSREIDEFLTVPSNDLRLVLPDADGTVTGTVMDHVGKPVADAEVVADLLHRKTHTDAQGRFELNGLVKGWFHITASARNAQAQELQFATRVKTGTTALHLKLPEHVPEPFSLPDQPLNLIGQTALPLHVETWIHSQPLTPQTAGKVRIIDFWGLQCGPCLAALPKVAAFWQEHQHEDLEIIAHCSYPPKEVREFLSKHPDYNFPIAIAADHSTYWRDYDIRGIPTYVVIDRTGKIVSYGHDWQAGSLAALAELKK